MRFTDAIALRSVPKPARVKRKAGWPEDSDEPYCEVMLQGVSTGRILQAGVLCAALEAPGGYLLLTTDGELFEDALTITLMSPVGQILDKASIGHCYTAGTFEDARLEEGNSVGFRYLDDCRWHVRVLPRSTWRIPVLTEPQLVWRRFGFKRRFVVSRTPAQSAADAPA